MLLGAHYTRHDYHIYFSASPQWRESIGFASIWRKMQWRHVYALRSSICAVRAHHSYKGIIFQNAALSSKMSRHGKHDILIKKKSFFTLKYVGHREVTSTLMKALKIFDQKCEKAQNCFRFSLEKSLDYLCNGFFICIINPCCSFCNSISRNSISTTLTP